ncbi:MAG: MFS transporter [Rickettsia sp.]|nr:MFS transporter [Rickettsia sp.]
MAQISTNNQDYLKYFVYSKNSIFPRFLLILFFVELWERFSYYGLRSLLFKHFVYEMGMSDAHAYFLYSFHGALGYALVIIGGVLADKLLGFIKMTLIGCVVIAFGHFLIFFSKWNSDLVFLGLAFIAIGSGFFKGNITNLLGLCYKDNNQEKKISGFTLFYVAVNVGSFSASIICGYTKSYFGWHIALSLAGLGMLFGLMTFLKYKHVFAHLDITKQISNRTNMKRNITILMFFTVIFAFLLAFILKYSYFSKDFFNSQNITSIKILKIIMYIISFFILGKIFFSLKSKQEKKNIIILFIFLVFYVIFYMYEMHLGSLFLIFMDRHTNNSILSFHVPSEVSQAINPMAVMIFGFFMSRIIKSNVKTDILNFLLGLFTIILCFAILYLGTKYIDVLGKTHYVFPMLAIVVMSIGEILIAPFIQSKTTELAPARWKGFTMGLTMGSLSISNIWGGVIISDMFSVGRDDNFSSLQSLEIYKEGFLQIVKNHMLVIILFVILIPLIRKLLKTSK